MSHDIQTKTCKICKELKNRIQLGTFGKKSNKRWVDTDGKLWNGLVCPDCHRKRALVNMHNLRAKASVEVSEAPGEEDNF